MPTKTIAVSPSNLVKLFDGTDCQGYFDLILWENGEISTIPKNNHFASTPEMEYTSFSVIDGNANIFISNWSSLAMSPGIPRIEEWDFSEIIDELLYFLQENANQDISYIDGDTHNLDWEIILTYDFNLSEFSKIFFRKVEEEINRLNLIYDEKSMSYKKGSE